MKSGFLKTLLYLTGFFIFLAPYNAVHADETEFTAQAKTTVSQGETFRVVYSLNAQGENFQAPGFKGFSVVSGPNPSTSQSFQMINGKVTQSVQQSFTYLLNASATGTYDIGPASINVDGKTIRSNALKITVVAGNTSNTRPSQSSSPSSSQSNDGDAGVSKDDIFLRTTVSKSNPMQGEQIVATLKVYTRVGISSMNFNSSLTTVPGFWATDLLKNVQTPTEYEMINGERYMTKELQKVALFPLKSGDQSIPAIDIDVVAQIQKTKKRSRSGDPFFDSFFNDAFFNSSVEQVPMKLKAPAIRVSVQPLPDNGKPVGFTGAVGNFNIEATADRSELKANEAINLKITISGIGNIDLIEKPAIGFPGDFETYDPKVSNISQTSGGKLGGKKVFDYTVIPRNAGTFTLKPIEFSYFDPTQRKYVSLKTKEFIFNVAKGDGSASNVTYSGVNQQDIQYIGSDIHHIKIPPFTLYATQNILTGSLLYWIILLGLLILATAIYLYLYQLRKRAGNLGQLRLRRANKISRKRLRKASEHMKAGRETDFYNEVSAALWGYLSDKFNIPLAVLSMDSVNEALLNKKVSPEMIEQFTETLNNCDFARFAPGDKVANMEGIYEQASAIITRIERELR